MTSRLRKGLLALAWLTLSLAADPVAADRAGRFDFYVLSLSWSPSYCARAGRDADPTQCRGPKPFGFIVHGLWPQYERGYPDFCTIPRGSEPDRQVIAKMMDIMPSRSLIRHQWRKHGSCSGLDADEYFRLTREAYAKVRIPPAFRTLERNVSVEPDAVEKAFRLANPGLRDTAIAVDCQAGRLSEVRICFTRDLDFRSCPAIDRRGCRASRINLPAPH